LLQQVSVDRGRPVVRLTAKGSEVMRGACPVDEALLLPSALVAKLGRRRNKAQPAPANIKIEDSSPTPRDEIHEPTERRDSQSAVRPNYYWTWQLLRDGYTLDDCFQIRGLAHDDVIDHLTRAVEDGLAVDPAWVLWPDRLELIQRFVAQLQNDRRPHAADLPEGVRYTEFQLVLQCHQAKKPQ